MDILWNTIINKFLSYVSKISRSFSKKKRTRTYKYLEHIIPKYLSLLKTCTNKNELISVIEKYNWNQLSYNWGKQHHMMILIDTILELGVNPLNIPLKRTENIHFYPKGFISFLIRYTPYLQTNNPGLFQKRLRYIACLNLHDSTTLIRYYNNTRFLKILLQNNISLDLRGGNPEYIRLSEAFTRYGYNEYMERYYGIDKTPQFLDTVILMDRDIYSIRFTDEEKTEYAPHFEKFKKRGINIVKSLNNFLIPDISRIVHDYVVS